MVMVNIDNEIYQDITKYLEKADRVEYPTVKNFIDKTLKSKIKKEMKE